MPQTTTTVPKAAIIRMSLYLTTSYTYFRLCINSGVKIKTFVRWMKISVATTKMFYSSKR